MEVVVNYYILKSIIGSFLIVTLAEAHMHRSAGVRPSVSLSVCPFFTRDSIYAIARICHGNSVRPSVRLSVTRVDQSKTVEARITQFSPYSSPIPLVFRG